VGVAFGQSDPRAALRAGSLAVDPVVGYYAPSTYARLASGGSVNDVALLCLRAPAPGTVDLLPASQTGLPAVGQPAAVLGWGQLSDGSMPHALQQGGFTLQAYNRCSLHFGGYDPNTMLCAWGTSSQSTCHGDSGGPVAGRRCLPEAACDRRRHQRSGWL
jgi:hypothetical protein